VSALGLAVASWPYWAGTRGAVLRAPLLADATLVMDAGLVLGALLAAAVAGGFALRQRLPCSTLLAAVLGGIVTHTGWIAHIKEVHGLPVRRAPNRRGLSEDSWSCLSRYGCWRREQPRRGGSGQGREG
jgi:hypothetical protein